MGSRRPEPPRPGTSGSTTSSGPSSQGAAVSPGSRAAGLARPPPPLHAPGSPSCLCIPGGRRHPTRAGHKSVSTTEARPTRRGHRVLHALSGHAALASGGQGLWPRWPRGPVTRDPLPWAPRDAPLGRREDPGGPQTQHPHGVGAPHREHPDWRERVATHCLPPAESLPLSSPAQIRSPSPAPGLASLFPGHAAPTRDVHTRKGPRTLGGCGQHSLSRQGSWMSGPVRSCSSKPPAPRGRRSVDRGQEGRGWPGGRLCVASPCGGSIRAAPAAPTASSGAP